LNTPSFNPSPIPLGNKIPDSPHAVSVSLPSISDVIAFKKKEPEIMAKVRSGYPRFVRHPYVAEFADAYRKRNGMSADRQPLFFASPVASEDALRLHPQYPDATTDTFQGVSVIIADTGSDEETAFSKYIQHTGTGISSREAEDLLMMLDPNRSYSPDGKTLKVGNDALLRLLHQWFAPSSQSTIFPCKCGMNAFYSVFKGINQLQSGQNRKDWISIGWLYLDTVHILNQYMEPGGQSIWFKNPSDTQNILDYIASKGSSVAGLIVEAPTNPLVHTPDIARISEACQKAGILTVMDPSLVSPKNVDLSPWCDVICCSLTKYAAYAGDVLIGAVSVNTERGSGRELEGILPGLITSPYHRDCARLAASLEDADEVLDRINANTMILADYFNHHAGVEKVYWAYADGYKKYYTRIHRSEARPGGVITLKLKKPLPHFYDSLPLPKGPSFGTAFTLVCAYIQIAHYDLLNTEVGRKQMADAGIHPDMVRLSIGTENAEDLMRIFDQALK
jgi:cystathionine gamma-synthase